MIKLQKARALLLGALQVILVACATESKLTVLESPVSENWQASATGQLKTLALDNLLYSKEAISAGLEGTVEVMLILNSAGYVIASRVEKSSGYELLDRDARNAAKRLIFPSTAPREIILPIHFRLK